MTIPNVRVTLFLSVILATGRPGAAQESGVVFHPNLQNKTLAALMQESRMLLVDKFKELGDNYWPVEEEARENEIIVGFFGNVDGPCGQIVGEQSSPALVLGFSVTRPKPSSVVSELRISGCSIEPETPSKPFYDEIVSERVVLESAADGELTPLSLAQLFYGEDVFLLFPSVTRRTYSLTNRGQIAIEVVQTRIDTSTVRSALSVESRHLVEEKVTRRDDGFGMEIHGPENVVIGATYSVLSKPPFQRLRYHNGDRPVPYAAFQKRFQETIHHGVGDVDLKRVYGEIVGLLPKTVRVVDTGQSQRFRNDLEFVRILITRGDDAGALREVRKLLELIDSGQVEIDDRRR